MYVYAYKDEHMLNKTIGLFMLLWGLFMLLWVVTLPVTFIITFHILFVAVPLHQLPWSTNIKSLSIE